MDFFSSKQFLKWFTSFLEYFTNDRNIVSAKYFAFSIKITEKTVCFHKQFDSHKNSNISSSYFIFSKKSTNNQIDTITLHWSTVQIWCSVAFWSPISVNLIKMDIIVRSFALATIISLCIQFSLSSQSIPREQQIREFFKLSVNWETINQITNILASILKQCHKNDPNLSQCLRGAIEAIRVNLSQGIPELLIPPCEPLKISEIRIKQNAGAIRMDSEYNNIVISGLSNFTLRDINVDTKMNSVRADLWFPVLQMTSNYMLQGKVLLMPLAGSGTASGNFSE